MIQTKSKAFCRSRFVIKATLILLLVARSYSTRQNLTDAEPRHRRAIVNGETVEKGRYGYAVSIMYRFKHICGGSLIAKDIVLSAAHCFESLDQTDTKNLKVVVGEHHLQDWNDGGEIFFIEEVQMHHDFNPNTYEHDVLVFKILGMSSETPVKLNRRNKIPNNWGRKAALTVMGWGSLDVRGHTFANVLKEVQLGYIGNKECASRGISSVTDKMMCALDIDDDEIKEDSCYGDSGGALIRKRQTETGDLQVGIVSFGAKECGVFPGVYTRISSVYAWIKKRVCELSDKPPDDFECNQQNTFVLPTPLSTTNTPAPTLLTPISEVPSSSPMTVSLTPSVSTLSPTVKASDMSESSANGPVPFVRTQIPSLLLSLSPSESTVSPKVRPPHTTETSLISSIKEHERSNSPSSSISLAPTVFPSSSISLAPTEFPIEDMAREKEIEASTPEYQTIGVTSSRSSSSERGLQKICISVVLVVATVFTSCV